MACRPYSNLCPELARVSGARPTSPLVAHTSSTIARSAIPYNTPAAEPPVHGVTMEALNEVLVYADIRGFP